LELESSLGCARILKARFSLSNQLAASESLGCTGIPTTKAAESAQYADSSSEEETVSAS
jgi:hypothetical protein